MRLGVQGSWPLFRGVCTSTQHATRVETSRHTYYDEGYAAVTSVSLGNDTSTAPLLPREVRLSPLLLQHAAPGIANRRHGVEREKVDAERTRRLNDCPCPAGRAAVRGLGALRVRPATSHNPAKGARAPRRRYAMWHFATRCPHGRGERGFGSVIEARSDGMGWVSIRQRGSLAAHARLGADPVVVPARREDRARARRQAGQGRVGPHTDAAIVGLLVLCCIVPPPVAHFVYVASSPLPSQTTNLCSGPHIVLSLHLERPSTVHPPIHHLHRIALHLSIPSSRSTSTPPRPISGATTAGT